MPKQTPERIIDRVYAPTPGGAIIAGGNNGGIGSGGVTDHGNLTGLADDDHTQYFNQSRGDARYSQIGHNIVGSDHTVTGAAWKVVGLTSTNTLGLLSSTTDGDTNVSSLLRVDSAGSTKLRKLADADYQAPNPFTNGFQIAELPGDNDKYRLNIGRIEADELIVKVFTADETIVRRGSDWLTPTFGVIAADDYAGTESYTVPAENSSVNIWFSDSVHVAGALFTNNEWVLIQMVERDSGLTVLEIWGQVSSYTTDANHDDQQRWTFTNRTAGVAGFELQPGGMVMGFGDAGDGWIYRTTLGGGPRAKYATWTGTNPRDGTVTTQVQLGDLSDVSGSVYGDLSGEYGLWAADAVYIEGANLGAAGGDFYVNDYGVNIKAGTASSADLSDYSDKITFTTDSLDPSSGSPVLQLYGLRYEQTPGNYVAHGFLSAQAGGSTGNYSSVLQLEALGTSTSAYIRLDDAAGSPSITLSAMASTVPQDIDIAGNLVMTVGSSDILPGADSTVDIGSSSKYFDRAYIRDIYADVFHGDLEYTGTLTGNWWSGDGSGNMTIDLDAVGAYDLIVTNSEAGGSVNLDVQGTLDVQSNIVVGGTVDGVDVAGLSSAYTTHSGATAAHGATGAVVGTTNTQTLTNKTLASPTVTGTLDGEVANFNDDVDVGGTLTGTDATFTGDVEISGKTFPVLTISSQSSGHGILRLSGTGTQRGGRITFQNAGTKRWEMRSYIGAESGSNVGSDFALYAYDDDGVAEVLPALRIYRASNYCVFGGGALWQGSGSVTDDFTIGGDLDVSGTLDVAQSAEVTQYVKALGGATIGAIDTPGYTLDVRGNANIATSLGVGGAATVGTTLDVTGHATAGSVETDLLQSPASSELDIRTDDLYLSAEDGTNWWWMTETGNIRSQDVPYSDTYNGIRGVLLDPKGLIKSQYAEFESFGADILTFKETIIHGGSDLWTPGGGAQSAEDVAVGVVGDSLTIKVLNGPHGQIKRFNEGYVLEIWGIANYSGADYNGYGGYSWEIAPIDAYGSHAKGGSITARVWVRVTAYTQYEDYFEYDCDIIKTTRSNVTLSAGAGIASWLDPENYPFELGYINAVANDDKSPAIEIGRAGKEPWNDQIYPTVILGRLDRATFVGSGEHGILITTDATLRKEDSPSYIIGNSKEIATRNIDQSWGAGDVITARLEQSGRLRLGTNVDEAITTMFDFNPARSLVTMRDASMYLLNSDQSPYFEINKDWGITNYVGPADVDWLWDSVPDVLRKNRFSWHWGGTDYSSADFDSELLTLTAEPVRHRVDGPGTQISHTGVRAEILVDRTVHFDGYAYLRVGVGNGSMQSAIATFGRSADDVPIIKLNAQLGSIKMDARIHWTNWKTSATSVGELYVDGSGFVKVKTS